MAQTPQRFTLASEYIELNALLKLLGLAESGGHAKSMIADGLVRVDGQVEGRIRRKLRVGNRVQVAAATIEIVV